MNKLELYKIQSIGGEVFLCLNEISAILPNKTSQSNPCLLLKNGEKIYVDNYYMQQLKKLFTIITL